MEDNDNDGDLSDETKKEMKKLLLKETEKIKQEVLDDLPQNFLKRVDKHRANEIRNKIGISINMIFHWITIGISLDITPIRVPDNPTPAPEIQKILEEIKRTNLKLEEIYKLPLEQKQLPFTLPSEQSEQKDIPTESSKKEEVIDKKAEAINQEYKIKDEKSKDKEG